jgi:hypothetical protein
MQSSDSIIHNKITDRVSKGIASKFVDALLNAIFYESSSIAVYSFYWDDLSTDLVKKVSLVTNTLTDLYRSKDLEYLKVITKRIKIDYFKNSLAITLQTKGLITKEYRRSLEMIFLKSNLRVEFPDSNSCIITLR